MRPMSQKEKIQQYKTNVEINRNQIVVTLADSDTPCIVSKHFSFDRVFGATTSQLEVFEEVRPALNDFIDGANIIIFASGTRGAGKRFTMEGIIEQQHQLARLTRIIPRAIEHIFSIIHHSQVLPADYKLEVAMVQSYQSEIYDLLNPNLQKLKIKETNEQGVYIEGLTNIDIKSKEEALQIWKKGKKNQDIACIKMGKALSRSTLIFIITLRRSPSTSQESYMPMQRLHFVKLAGSERQYDKASLNSVTQLKYENRDLKALMSVMEALSNPKYKFVPYRESKLTRMLQETLSKHSSKSKIVWIANIGPADISTDDTIRTLRVAKRLKRRNLPQDVIKEAAPYDQN